MTTTKLNLPEMTASQSQKHVTHNEALAMLDALVQLSVADKDLSTPPGSPSTGDTYIVGSSATGDWTSKEDQIATYDGAGWIFLPPNDGWLCWVDDEAEIYFYNSGWTVLGSGGGGGAFLPLAGGTLTGTLFQVSATPVIRMTDTGASGYFQIQGVGGETRFNMDLTDAQANSVMTFFVDGAEKARINQHGLGVGGATPDATNGFAFNGTNMLLNSSSDINLVYNKNAAGDDASMTFQSGFATQALMGLLGDNDFTIKVGASFTTALVIDNATGDVSFPAMTSIRNMRSIKGRYSLYTDLRWVGPAPGPLETVAGNFGTGVDPTEDWDAKGEFYTGGSVLKKMRITYNLSSAEVTGVSYKVYFKYGDWDGTWDTNGESTRVEVTGGTFTFAGTDMTRQDIDLGDYACPDDGYLMLMLKPSGTVTATRYFQFAGVIDAVEVGI